MGQCERPEPEQNVIDFTNCHDHVLDSILSSLDHRKPVACVRDPACSESRQHGSTYFKSVAFWEYVPSVVLNRMW
jgi:hypothetical protein